MSFIGQKIQIHLSSVEIIYYSPWLSLLCWALCLVIRLPSAIQDPQRKVEVRKRGNELQV